MEGGPVVLLGQGEQYAEPEEWRELMRTRRIRRGVELAVRRHGLTTLLPPEEVPELAAVLDQVDPPGPPPQPTASPAARPSSATPAPGRPAAPPPSRVSAAGSAAGGSAPAAQAGAEPHAVAPRPLPTAAPRKRWRFGVWRWVFAVAALLVVRLCARDGFGGLPAFGTRADTAPTSAASPSAGGCAHPRGWIAKAACDDPGFARIRPELAHAYSARLSDLTGEARVELADEQARWQASRGKCRAAADPGACLTERYRARIAELQNRAEAAPPPPPVVADPASSDPPPPGAPAVLAAASEPVAVVERPEWVRRPGPGEVADAYPERARRLDIDGRALLSCRATVGGGLAAGDVVSEDPADYGFGGAALRLSRFYQLRPRTADGRPVEGAKVDVPIAFKGG